jgi:hypothetical protein
MSRNRTTVRLSTSHSLVNCSKSATVLKWNQHGKSTHVTTLEHELGDDTVEARAVLGTTSSKSLKTMRPAGASARVSGEPRDGQRNMGRQVSELRRHVRGRRRETGSDGPGSREGGLSHSLLMATSK